MRLLAILNSFWRVPIILLMTVGLATISVIASWFDSTGKRQHQCARAWGALVLWISRVKVITQGMDQLDPKRGYIFMANHLSMFDHWAFLGHLPFHIGFAAKASLFSIPLLGWHLSRSGSIPVDRKRPRRTLQNFEKIGKEVKKGVSFVIYPEGGRTFGDRLTSFKRGPFLLAKSSSAPIVPVTIIGAHRRLRRGSIIIWPGMMEMIFHPVLEFQEYKHMDSRQLSGSVRRIIERSYRQVED